MKKTAITDTIVYLEPDSYAAFQSCAGLMVSDDRKILIDANMGQEDTRPFLEAEQPDRAVITHYHMDHAAWGADIRELTSADFFMPADEVGLLKDVDTFVGHTAGPYGLLDTWASFLTKDCRFRPIEGVQGYRTESDFSDAGVQMRVVSTPGHSPGHTSFYFPNDGILFTGDMGIDRFGPWYGWQDCSIPDLVESLWRLKGLNARVLLTSHSGMITKGISALWDRAVDIVFQREALIRAALDAGKDKNQIVSDGVFFLKKNGVPEPVRSFLFMWDSFMFDHHARLLETGGLAGVNRLSRPPVSADTFPG